jgi:hypothetical protein
MFNLFKINTKSNKNFKMSIIMEVRYFDETKKFDSINNYQQFLEKCYKEFDMSVEEKKSLKIFILDDRDEMTVENEEDFNDNKNSINDNNELNCI